MQLLSWVSHNAHFLTYRHASAFTSCCFSQWPAAWTKIGLNKCCTCQPAQRSSFLVLFDSARMQQKQILKLEREERARKLNLHCQTDGEPLVGLTWNTWCYSMRTALLTDPSILSLCWESSTSLPRSLWSQNCQMATPPFMWKKSWYFLKRQHAQWYTLCSAITKYILSLCVSFPSLNYHRKHDVQTSLTFRTM